MTIAVVDYGSGNLRSAAKALERVSAEAGLEETVIVTDSAAEVAAAARIVLPGQGAFLDCWRGLNAVPGMVAALQAAVVEAGRPFLGICVGMQLMASVGREHGDCPGLGWLPGEVVPLAPGDSALKIPHMGWNELKIAAPDHPVLSCREDVIGRRFGAYATPYRAQVAGHIVAFLQADRRGQGRTQA